MAGGAWTLKLSRSGPQEVVWILSFGISLDVGARSAFAANELQAFAG